MNLQNSFYATLSSKDKYILWCCFFIFAVNGLYSMILGSLLPLISEAYHLNNTVSGSLISAHQVGNIISGFGAGLLPLIMDRKKAILMLSVFMVIGFVLMTLTGNPILLLSAFLMTGLSRGSISNFNNTVVNEISGSSSAALTILHSVFAVGALLAPFLAMAVVTLTPQYSFRLAAWVIAGLGIIAWFLFSKMELAPIKAKRPAGDHAYGFLKDKTYLLVAGLLLTYLCGEAGVNGWLVKYFVDTGTLPIKMAQYMASLLWTMILIGRLSCAFISTKVRSTHILMVLSTFTLLFYCLLLWVKSPIFILIAIAGLGLFMAGAYPISVSVVGPILKTYPMAMSVLLLIGGVGAILMPMITGLVADFYGLHMGMSMVLLAMAGAVILSLLLHRRIRSLNL